MNSGIIKLIKEIALNVFESNKPVKVLFGKVISTNPVTIQCGEHLKLTREFLVINGTVFEGDNVTLIRCQGGQKYVVLGTRTETINNTIYLGGDYVTVIDRAIAWALQIANDNSHKYSQSVRWGPSYDCSSFIISAYEQAGVPVKSKGGATTTSDMRKAFLACGFKDVTKAVTLSSGQGLLKGDVLLTEGKHTALVYADGGAIVHASSPSKGILTRSYYNSPWKYVLRYSGQNGGI